MWIKNCISISKLIALFIICLSLAGCESVQFPDLQQMMLNLSQSLPPIWKLVTAISYLLGIGFIMRAVYALKIYGDMRTQASQNPSIKTPLIFFVVGAALIFLPSTKSVVLTTIFAYGTPQPLSYTSSNPLISTQIVAVVMQIVQLVGLISFIRGWMILAQATSGGGGQQHTFGKAMTHIIGGILAINVEGTKELLQATFGLS